MNKNCRSVRIRLADALESNGGYYCRDVHAALSWDVSLWNYNMHLILHHLAVEGQWFVNEAAMRLQYPLIEREVERLLEMVHPWAQETMCENLDNDDGLKMWSPVTAAKHGFDYTGDGAEKTFDVEFGLYGRGGKHLCVTEFKGRKVDRDLIDVLREVGESYHCVPNLWCRQLLAMIEEWNQCFSREAVLREYNYQLAWQIGRVLEDEWEQRFEAAA